MTDPLRCPRCGNEVAELEQTEFGERCAWCIVRTIRDQAEARDTRRSRRRKPPK